MNTHPTAAAARTYALGLVAAKKFKELFVAEIEHRTAGRVFIVITSPFAIAAAQHARKPMPEVVRFIAEHEHRSDEAIAAEAARRAAAEAKLEAEKADPESLVNYYGGLLRTEKCLRTGRG